MEHRIRMDRARGWGFWEAHKDQELVVLRRFVSFHEEAACFPDSQLFQTVRDEYAVAH